MAFYRYKPKNIKHCQLIFQDHSLKLPISDNGDFESNLKTSNTFSGTQDNKSNIEQQLFAGSLSCQSSKAKTGDGSTHRNETHFVPAKCKLDSTRIPQAHLERNSKPKFDQNEMTQDFLKMRETVTPDDEYDIVAGHEAVKDAIQDAFLQSNSILESLNPKLRMRGILLVGMPGVGKTDLMTNSAARVAKIIKKPIATFNVSMANLLSKYIGESEKAVNVLWKVAQDCCPSLILLDEVDSLVKSRHEEESDHSRRLKNEILTKLEGHKVFDNVVIVAASNRGYELDRAFLRRFKKKFYLRLPSDEERLVILYKFLEMAGHLTKFRLTAEQELEFTTQTMGFTGDDVKTVVMNAVEVSLRVSHKGCLYRTREINSIRQEPSKLIPAQANPVIATVSALTVEILFAAIKDTVSSYDPEEARKLTNWAATNCKDSNYQDVVTTQVRVSTSRLGNLRRGIKGMFHQL